MFNLYAPSDVRPYDKYWMSTTPLYHTLREVSFSTNSFPYNHGAVNKVLFPVFLRTDTSNEILVQDSGVFHILGLTEGSDAPRPLDDFVLLAARDVLPRYLSYPPEKIHHVIPGVLPIPREAVFLDSLLYVPIVIVVQKILFEDSSIRTNRGRLIPLSSACPTNPLDEHVVKSLPLTHL